MSKEIKDLKAADFTTPAGTTIIATVEIVPGTCGITADEEGWDHDGSGTDVNWDGQDSEKDAKGRDIWEDDDGERWVWNGTAWEEPATTDPVRDAAPAMLAALKALHSCHRAFSSSEQWTALDDDARAAAEAAIAAAEGRATAAPPLPDDVSPATEAQEIAAMDLVRTISRFTEPGADADDDRDTIASLIHRARTIVREGGAA
jgi:hypothetical protein